MPTFDERQQQYQEQTLPSAYRAYVADGIRKKFANDFDIPQDWTPEQVISKHYQRFGGGMKPADYEAKLDQTYGQGFKAPAAPTPTLGDRVEQAGSMAGDFAKGIAPFLMAETPRIAGAAIPAAKAAAEGASKAIPFVSQAAFLGGHAINAGVDAATAQNLQKTEESLPQPDLGSMTEDFYSKLQPGLAAKGYTDDQIRREAASRALNVTNGYQSTVTSIDQQVQEAQRAAAIKEPANAVTDAFFLGVGAPTVTKALSDGLAKAGFKTAAEATKPVGNIAGSVFRHMKSGALVGAGGMAIQSGAVAGLNAEVENKSPQEVAKALAGGAKSGAITGALFGSTVGAAAGTLEAGAAKIGARMAAADAARLTKQQAIDAEFAQKRADDMAKAARTFNPHTQNVDGDPGMVAFQHIQQKFGPDAAMSEPGMRAASEIEQRIRLTKEAQDIYNTSGAASPIGASGNAVPAQPVGAGLEPQPGVTPEPNIVGELPVEPSSPAFTPPAAPSQADLTPAPEQPPAPVQPTNSALPETPPSGPNLGKPLGPIETGGRPEAPPEEINPRLGPQTEEQPAPPAPAPAAVQQTAAAPPRKARKEAPTPQPVAAQAAALPPPPKSTPEPLKLPTRADAAIASMPKDAHVDVQPAEDGHALHIARVGLEGKVAEKGAIENALKSVTDVADQHRLPVVLRITQAAGPRGGKIPVEKQIEWYKKFGFQVTKMERPLPEGMASGASLRRVPQPVANLDKAKAAMMNKIRAQANQ